MGTEAAPNILLTLTKLSDGSLDTGLTIELIPNGSVYPTGAISLTEIGVTGKYKNESAVGVAAVSQGLYGVYDSGTFRSWHEHGIQATAAHLANVSNPHSVGASQVAIVDAGTYYTASDTEDALQEIGASLALKADIGNTLLLDSSTQSVDESKPLVDNLNAEMVNGAKADNLSGGLVVLDSNARVPLGNIADELDGISADQVDGHDAGSSAGDVPILAAGASVGKLATALLNKTIGSSNGNIVVIGGPVGPTTLSSTLLNKLVGSSDGNIVLLSATRAAGVLSTTFLNREKPLTANVISDNGVDTPRENMVVQSGWLSMVGNGLDNLTFTIVFPHAFLHAPIVTFSSLGRRAGSAPTTIGDFNASTGDGITLESENITVAGLSVDIKREAGLFGVSDYYGISWMAIGQTSAGL